MDGHSPLSLKLPGFARDESAKSSGERRNLMNQPLVFWHDLYAIIPPGMVIGDLHVKDAAGDIDWRRALYPMGYVVDPTSVYDYYRMLDKHDQTRDLRPRLFGERANPIHSVLELGSRMDDLSGFGTGLVLHHIMAVALQYYLIASGAFMRRRVDAEAPFSEALPSSVFLMFKKTDWYIDKHTMTDAPNLAGDLSNLESEAATRSFPIFLYQVIGWVLDHVNAGSAQLADSIRMRRRKFCTEKLRKNFIQALTCMRFRQIIPSNMIERLAEVGIQATRSSIKFFANPQACRMPSIDVAAKPRRKKCDNPTPFEAAPDIPQFFCHIFFSSVDPILIADEDGTPDAERHLVWSMLLYYPLTNFKQGGQVATRSLLPCGLPILPSTACDKYGDYDAYIALSASRARYSMYFTKTEVFAFVPALLLPDDTREITPIRDEADPRCMSDDAWRWNINYGEMMATRHPTVIAHSLASRNTTLHEVELREAADIIARNRPHDEPSLFFWALCVVSRSEEYACAVMHRRFKITLETLQADKEERIAQVLSHAKSYCAELAGYLFKWDRCSPFEPDESVAKISARPEFWRTLFPPSIIGFGSEISPWISAWCEISPVLAVLSIMTHVQNSLNRPILLHELKDLGQPTLVDRYHALNALVSEFKDDVSAAVTLGGCEAMVDV